MLTTSVLELAHQVSTMWSFPKFLYKKGKCIGMFSYNQSEPRLHVRISNQVWTLCSQILFKYVKKKNDLWMEMSLMSFFCVEFSVTNRDFLSSKYSNSGCPLALPQNMVSVCVNSLCHPKSVCLYHPHGAVSQEAVKGIPNSQRGMVSLPSHPPETRVQPRGLA